MAVQRAVERRIVTILFADLVGFTSLSERLDAEDVATVQSAYFATVRETIERYGGRLEKFIGDAAMAVFGVPRARDDDGERAVRAGLALAAAVEQLGARIGLEAGSLGVRVGVNSGEVVHTPDAGPEEAMVTGDPVNVAARLQAAAGRGEVLVGETTALAVAGAAVLDEPQALDLKGKAEPVPARRVLGLRAEPSRDSALGSLRAPLLGRDEELRLLLDEAEHAQLESRLVLLVAPPGVGKTRLVEELAARAEDAAVARARLRPDVLAPFDPVAQLLATAGLPDDEEELEERLRGAGIPAARARALAEEALAVLRPSSEPALAADRESRFAAWVELLDALAGDRTGVWIVEDVHWAGPDLLAFLGQAAAAPGGRLVLATARPVILETAAEWCAASSLVHLQALPPADASALVRALVGEALPAELVTEIAVRSDGNALFIEELLRMWIGLGELRQEEGGGWRLVRPAQDVPLPQTVQTIYAAQLDDLPASARDVARRASVAGRRFPEGSLEALEVSEARSGLELLERRALVAGPSADDLFGASYAYRHALLRDAGYASLARAERVRLHVSLARWLETTARERSGQAAELIGRHYARALASMPALALEASPGIGKEDCRRLAAAWFERAAEFSLELDAHESARELLGRSLELTAGDESVDRARRLATLGDATASSVDMDEGARLLEESLDLVRAVGDRAGIARAAASLSRILDQQVQFMPAARMADGALAEIGEADDLETGWLLLRRAIAIGNGRDEVDGPRADAERALAIARSAGDGRLELEALQLLAGLGRTDLDAVAELERLALERRAWTMAADALHTGALVRAPDHAAEAIELADRMLELCEAHGLREDLAWSHYVHVEIGLVSGDWEGAVGSARRALDIGIAGGYDRAVVRTWSTVLPIASARGDAGLLREGHAWLTRRFREPENPSPYALVMGAARKLEVAHAGLGEPFVPDVDERIRSFRLPYATPSWLAGLETVFDSWLEAGELDGAARALEAMRESAEDPPAATLRRAAYRLLCARLSAVRGEDPAGEARRALEGFRESAAPWWIAKALRLLPTPEAEAEATELERSLGIPG
jgi:class 3 adenylate cyclase